MHSLAPIVLVLLCAVLVVICCKRINIPPMLGYLLVGFIVGPGVLRLVPQGSETEFLGEIGIVFLMFSIGLEFSLAKLKAMRQLVFGVGFLQVCVTLIVVMAAIMLATGSALSGFAIGGAIALSSTAIVSKLLTERLEINQNHGQLAIGVLLFQDLAVVPLLILLPAFASQSSTLWFDLMMAGIKVVAVMALLLYFGQKLMRPWFYVVAKQRSGELFMVNVLLVTLGVAYLTELSGLSLALGAFVAGMLISETEYRFQVEEDIRPFRDILLGFFFITIGMKLDLSVLVNSWDSILWLLILIVPVKALIVFGLAKWFGHRTSDSIKGALALAQGGEFGFVLLAQGAHLHMLPPELTQVALASILLSMLLAPFLIQYADKIVARVVKNDWVRQAADLHQLLVESMGKDDHVIICGFGRSGQAISRLLEAENVPFFALDLDASRVQVAHDAGYAVGYGDSTKKEVLMSAGVQRAKAVIVSFVDVEGSERILDVVNSLRNDLPVFVRTFDDSSVDALKEHGAEAVVSDVLESSLMLASHALVASGISLNRVVRRVLSVRGDRYHLFRGFFRGMGDEIESWEDTHEQLSTVHLAKDAFAVGKSLRDLDLGRYGVEVRSLRRHNFKRNDLSADFVFEADDAVLLLGRPEDLAKAEFLLCQGE